MSALCSPGLFPAIRSNFQPGVRRNIPGPPDAIGQWSALPASADACKTVATLPGEQRAGWTNVVFLDREPFQQTLSLLRSKIAQSPFVEPSFGKMFLDLHSRHEKGKEALVRARVRTKFSGHNAGRGPGALASCERNPGHETRISHTDTEL